MTTEGISILINESGGGGGGGGEGGCSDRRYFNTN